MAFQNFLKYCLATTLTGATQLCLANYVVMPTHLNETTTTGYLSASFNLVNKGKDRIRIEPLLEPVNTSRNFKRLSSSSYQQTTYSLVQYGKTSPRLLIIQSKKSRTLRLRVRIPQSAPEGTYTGRLLIKMLPPDTTNPLQPQQAGDKKLSISLTPLINTAIPLYITKGTPTIGKVSLTCEQSGNHLIQVIENKSIWLQQIYVNNSDSKEATLLRLAPMSEYTYHYKGNSQQQVMWHYKSQEDQHTVTCTR